MKKFKPLLVVGLISSLLVNPFSNFVQAETASVDESDAVTFSDVSSSDYYSSAVQWAVRNNITAGVGNNQFSPGSYCTRGQIVTFLWRSAGQPEADGAEFYDVPQNSYAHEAVQWAASKNITSGVGGGFFAPDGYCTRGQIVSFLYRYLNPKESVKPSYYRDVSSSSYAYNAISWAKQAGVTSGVSSARFAPDGYCTRGDAVTFLHRAEVPSAAVKNTTFMIADAPPYAGSPYSFVNNDVTYFKSSDLTTAAFENYSSLDHLGRCGAAFANVCAETEPTGKRGSISSITPSGWNQAKYAGIDGGWLYNRCHLIGWQLTGEDANAKNLITGTRYMNISGMLDIENMVDNYVDSTGHHVLYRVTPMFDGNNLVADGVLMEGFSVEDQGAGINYCVYAYNVQPGVFINYADGSSAPDGTRSDVYRVSDSITSNNSGSGNGSGQGIRQNPTTKPSGGTYTGTVYWTPNGTKYHSTRNCRYLRRSKQIYSGTVQQAGNRTKCSGCW